MKKLILILVLLPIIISSCKKTNNDEKIEPEEELFTINLSLNGFKQSLNPMAFRSGSNENLDPGQLASGISIFISDKNGKKIATKYNALLDADMQPVPNSDKFSFQLPKGDYTISAITESSNGSFHESGINSVLTFTDYDIGFGRKVISYAEAYASQFISFSVSKDETLAPINLSRLNSKLEIEIIDQVPEEVKYILIGGLLPNTIYPFNPKPFSGTLTANNYMMFDVSSDVGKKNIVLSSILFQPNTELKESGNLEIVLYNKDKKFISSKKISNIVFKPNHITKLTGKIFDDFNDDGDYYGKEFSHSTSVIIDKDYSKEKINIEF